MSDEPRVKVTIEGGVADVRLNRPEKLNALDPAMFAAIVDAGEALKDDRSVRAVVLSGEGRGFCAGLDFAQFTAMAEQEESGGVDSASSEEFSDLPDGRITHRGQQAAWVWQELDVPVIGAINGHALGGGFQIAMGPDIRYVHPEARMSVLEIRWGLIPDMAASELLTRVVSLDVAKELYFTGRMITGEEAVELGVATHLSDDPHADAMELAVEIATKSPDAIRLMKPLLNGVKDRSPADNFALERQYISSLFGTPNQAESVRAFFEKRPPEFS